MALYRTQLRDAAAGALRGAGTIAGTNVLVAPDWPTEKTAPPTVLLNAPIEQKESLTPNGVPQFYSTVILEVQGRLFARDGQVALGLLDVLAEQIQLAILCSDELGGMVEEFTSVSLHAELNSEGGVHRGDVSIAFACKAPEDFEPAGGEELRQISVYVDINDDGLVDFQMPVVMDGSEGPTPFDPSGEETE